MKFSLPVRALLGLFLFVSCSHLLAARIEQSLSGPGWTLWRDKSAAYLEDSLWLPPVKISQLPVHEPSGGWAVLNSPDTLLVQIPGTAEQYLQTVSGPGGDITGVTWWSRSIKLPSFEGKQNVRLRFEATRQRAEVFVDRKLVGYDMVGNTPFEVDLGSDLSPGQELQLSVRITDAGGNFDWRDGSIYHWGHQQVLMSHGFGGISGDVSLIVSDPVHIADLAVLNTPEPRAIKVLVEVDNTERREALRELCISIVEASNPRVEVASLRQARLTLKANSLSSLEFSLAAPSAKLWDLEHPELYRCVVSLVTPSGSGDCVSRRFGFRWFGLEGIGRDATLRLNGRRIVLRTAISWGFWPLSGLMPSAELAEREVRVAKQLGQNMLNFHRCIGQPSVFDKADELGLLIFEEPGNWKGGDKAAFARTMADEKLLRMVRRDRSHPSLVIYNLINEDGTVNGADLAARVQALRAAHLLDPSRVITRTSGWSKPGADVEDPMKMHLRPYDTVLYSKGWYDFHHAGGPATWNQELYKGPSEHYNRTTNRGELVYWGEEGAISTPPRLGMIKKELSGRTRLGWDGAAYLAFEQQFDSFIEHKNLRASFPTVDALTGAMGNVSLEHQGRKIQLMRATEVSDGYAVNGWESELIENHSGIVDAFRNPKGDPSLMARYNQPLYVAILPRAQVGHAGSTSSVDFYVVNERDLKGPFQLEIRCLDALGQLLFTLTHPVELLGGDRYGQLLLEGIELPFGQSAGFTRIEARLLGADGAECAGGSDRLLCVDWKSEPLAGKGALYGQNAALRSFLTKEKGLDLPAYADGLGKLDWLLVARPPSGDQVSPIPDTQLRLAGAQGPGLRTSFYSDKFFSSKVGERIDRTAALNVADGATPDPSFPGTDGYHVRWQGELLPTVTGTYTFAVNAAGGGVRLQIADTVLIDGLAVRGRMATERVTLHLQAGRAVPLTLEYSHMRGAGRCSLLWAVPDTNPPDLERLLARVREDGTRLIILDYAADWMPLVAKYSKINYSGSFRVGSAWTGGIHFVRAHPLFKGLPSNDALGWPYQAVVVNGNERSGLLLDGEEFVAGAWHCNEEKTPMRLGTVVGLIPCGRGSVLFSTLAISEQLDNPTGPADVARKLLCNFLQYAQP